jgi:lipopolysaccharide transport system ATP-binding protein
MLAKPFDRFKKPIPADPIGYSEVASKSVEEFWALRDVSFQVGEGERIAIIGGNGAGKSTLLKTLSRITEPTSGRISIRGKVSSLLEVGTGFHPELTGRENIFLNGAILGMPRSEIKKKFDQIVDFSGVEKFLDTPVKHYSSGMYVRLAFSVSAWLDPDILIVDEVLSVGDQAFQKKCAERMRELTGDGRTVIFVSHSMAAVKTMCEKALYLKNGSVVSFGPVEEGAAEYVRSLSEADAEQWHRPMFVYESGKTEIYVDALSSNGFAECVEGAIKGVDGKMEAVLPINEPFCIHLTYKIIKEVPGRVVPNFHFYNEAGERFFVAYPSEPAPSHPGQFETVCEIPAYLFNVGRFTMMPVLSTYELDTPVHFALPNALRFEIAEPTGVDPRRHGWNGIVPGMSRPRLNWQTQTLK